MKRQCKIQFLDGPAKWSIVINGMLWRHCFKTEREAIEAAENYGLEVVK